MSSNIYDRTGLMETPRSKPSPPPPRVSKLNAAKSDGTSSSPVPNTRLSLDRSSPSQTVNSKPSSRTSRVPTPDVSFFCLLVPKEFLERKKKTHLLLT